MQMLRDPLMLVACFSVALALGVWLRRFRLSSL
jgi:hypothetical protein